MAYKAANDAVFEFIATTYISTRNETRRNTTNQTPLYQYMACKLENISNETP